jgi:hypothetical protein
MVIGIVVLPFRMEGRTSVISKSSGKVHGRPLEIKRKNELRDSEVSTPLPEHLVRGSEPGSNRAVDCPIAT